MYLEIAYRDMDQEYFHAGVAQVISISTHDYRKKKMNFQLNDQHSIISLCFTVGVALVSCLSVLRAARAYLGQWNECYQTTGPGFK